jgi:[ribosomal protein S18]-alanine N-acetyltransferase
VKFALREFRRQDFETLWAIDQACFAPGIAYSRRELSHYIRMTGSFTLVVQTTPLETSAPPETDALDPTILGFLVAETRRDTGHLITIDVLPRLQRSGVGSKLLTAAEDRLLTLSCRRVYLETAVDNAAAIAFYQRHLYFAVKTIPGYYSNGVDALILEKDLLSVRHAG